MEFGDLLYILLMVVAVAFSLIKKAKKQHHESPFPDFKTINLPEEIFPPGMFREEKPKVLTQPPENKDNSVNRLNFRKMDYGNRGQKQRTITSELKKRQETKIFLEEEKQIMSSYWEKEQFDLQNAVIYSEILRRPEY